jgi:hypothetical protein
MILGVRKSPPTNFTNIIRWHLVHIAFEILTGVGRLVACSRGWTVADQDRRYASLQATSSPDRRGSQIAPTTRLHCRKPQFFTEATACRTRGSSP